MGELKPCPFCGGKAHIRKIHGRARDNNGDVIKGKYHDWYALGCYTQDCICFLNIDSRSARFMFVGSIDGKETAIERWNRRAEHETD